MRRQLMIIFLILFPLVILADCFLDDVLHYGFESGSTTRVYVSGLRESSATDITIPSTVVYEYTDYNDKDDNGRYKIKHRTCTVTSISSQAFYFRTSLMRVVIPDSVTDIGWGAFSVCTNLTSITLPSNLTNIDGMMFYECYSLENVEIPVGVTNIGEAMFCMCSRLVNVVIPSSVKSIGESAFNGCYSITDVVIPDGVTSIEKGTFGSCRNLMNVAIPNSVTNIGLGAFSGCTKLVRIVIPSSVTNIGEGSFKACRNLTIVTIPDGVTSISQEAFGGCWNLTIAPISTSITNIGFRAFEHCYGLTDVSIPSNVRSIGTQAFQDCYNLGLFSFEGAPPSVGYDTYNGQNSFYNVKSGAIGTYTIEHKAEWETEIDSKGYWHGLKMQMAEPPPPLTLSVESADWSSGSITLCCDGTDSRHTYTLQYYDESKARCVDVTGGDAIVSIDANGNAHLTDKGFSSRLGGIPPVKYRVKEENSGRVSAECVTRTKYGIFVGLSKWSSSAYKETLADVGCANNAKKFRRLAAELKSFDDSNIKTLVNSDAKTNAVSAAFTEVSQKAIAGDICVFYFTTHGGFFGEKGSGLALYNGIYRDTAMASDIAKLDAANKGLAVVGIVSACHSVALYDNPSLGVNETQWYLSNDLAQCSPNVAWVTSASRAEESSYGLFDIFLLDYGWEKGWTGTGDTLTFLELAKYTKSRYDTVFNGIVFDHDGESYFKEVNIENDVILSRVMAGMRGSHGTNGEVLSTPQGVVASQGQYYTKIKASWNPVDEATGYAVFFRIGVGEKWTGCFWGQICECCLTAGYLEREYGDKFKSRDEDSPVFFAVKAFNGADVSDLSNVAEGWMDYKKMWERMIPWLGDYPSIISAAYGDFNVAIRQTAACGTRTVEECYILGIDPEDPNDDLKITDFKMEDGKPVITLNHTKDGSGNSFESRIKTLGKANLTDADWIDVTDKDQSAYRFFKVTVDLP